MLTPFGEFYNLTVALDVSEPHEESESNNKFLGNVGVLTSRAVLGYNLAVLYGGQG